MAQEKSQVHVILPIKDLSGVKTRLGNILNAEERRRLVHAMAEDVVTALKQVKGLGSIRVVSHDEQVARWAASRDLELIDDTHAKGLSEAIDLATRHLACEGHPAALIVLIDTPLATPEEFQQLLDAHNTGKPPHIVLGPSRDGDGSNALLVSPPDAMAFHYGKGSAAAHEQEAVKRGLRIDKLTLAGLGHDIDTESDLLDLIAETERLGRHSKTRQFLTSSGIAARMAEKNR